MQFNRKIVFALWLLLANQLFIHAQNLPDGIRLKLNKLPDTSQITFLLDQAKYNIRLNPELSKDIALYALQINNKIKNNKTKENEAQIFLQLGIAYFWIDNADSSLLYLNKAYLISKILRKKLLTSSCYLHIATIYADRTEYDTAIVLLRSGLKLSDENEDILGSADINRAFARIYWYLHDYKRANQYYLIALKKYESIDNAQGIADCYSGIGIINDEISDFDKALQFYDKALNIYTKSNDIRGLAKVYNNIGVVHERQGAYEKGLDYHNLSYSKSKEIGDQRGISASLHNLGSCYEAQNKQNEAIPYFLKSLDIDRKLNDRHSIVDNLEKLAKIYLQQNKIEEAEKYIIEGIYYSKEIRSDIHEKEFIVLQSNLYAQRKDFELALIASKRAIDLIDSINIRKRSDEISQLNQQYQIEKDEKEFDSRLKKQRAIIHGSIFGIIVIVAFLVFLFWQNRHIKRFTKKLKEQNVQLEQAQNLLHQKNIDLQTSEERFRRIVEELPVMINSIDINGNIVLWNRESELVTGYQSNEIIANSSALTLLYPDYDFKSEILRDYTDEKTYRNRELAITCKNGNKRIIEWSNLPSSIHIEGWIECIMGIDITARYQFERSLEKEKALLNSLIISTQDLIFYKNSQGTYLLTNPAFDLFYGLNPGEAIGKNDNLLFKKDIAELFLTTDQKSLTSNETYRYERWAKSADQQNYLLDTVITPISDSNKKLLGLVGISRDITERYKTELNLRIAKEKAEFSDKQKSTFLSNMSHEIRNLINALAGYADLIAQPDIPRYQIAEYKGYLKSTTDNLHYLINDIIDISKIEEGQLKIRRENCYLNKILAELYAAYRLEKKSKGKDNIELSIKLGNSDPDFMVNTDPYRLRQIISNLLSNAIKFVDTGKIEFGYKDDQNFSQEGNIEFFVVDTGIGIVPEQISSIFHRFKQLDTGAERNEKGKGLGLSIVKNLVDLLGGKIRVESVVGQGTSFYITLPYKPVENIKSTTSSQTEQLYDWSSKTILIAEDENMNYRLLEIALSKTKVKLIRAENGVQAFEYIKNNLSTPPDLILMDIQMPLMNGYEATSEIKKINQSIPIIAQTAFALEGEETKTKNAGCDGYLTKPIRQQKLFETISSFFIRQS